MGGPRYAAVRLYKAVVSLDRVDVPGSSGVFGSLVLFSLLSCFPSSLALCGLRASLEEPETGLMVRVDSALLQVIIPHDPSNHSSPPILRSKKQ
jgi:hypothetical protein